MKINSTNNLWILLQINGHNFGNECNILNCRKPFWWELKLLTIVTKKEEEEENRNLIKEG